MVSRLFHWSILIPLSAASLAAGPASRPATPLEEKQQEQAQSEAEAAKMPSLQANRTGDLVKFSIASDMLEVDLLPQVAPGEYHVILPKSNVVATLNRMPSGIQIPNSIRAFSLIEKDFSLPGAAEMYTTVIATNGSLQVVRNTGEDESSSQVELIQDAPRPPGQQDDAEPPVRLNVQEISDPDNGKGVQLKIAAASYVDLRRQYPHEVEKYLRPILRDLGQESILTVDAPAAWQVLADDWTGDDTLKDQVKSVVARTGAEAFSERRAALRDLRNLGEKAALVLMKTDRNGLSVEQTNAINTFLAPYMPLSETETKHLGGDPTFLLNLQYSDDVDLRKLAAARLTKVLGKPVGFDPAAADAVRIAGVEKLRSTVTPTTQP